MRDCETLTIRNRYLVGKRKILMRNEDDTSYIEIKTGVHSQPRPDGSSRVPTRVH
jgi:hypothetical protein